MKHIFFIFFLLYLLPSCQTFDSSRQVTPTAKEKSYFSKCEQGGGFASAEILIKNKWRYQGDFEWDLKAPNLYSFALLSPFGNSILKARKEQNSFYLENRNMGGRFHLTVDEDDFLHFNGHWVALKSEEFACFLEGKFSKSWLDLPFYSLKNKKNNYILPDGKRRIVMSFPKNEEEAVCGEIAWNSFWIFKISKIKICFEKKPVKTSFLSLDRQFKITVEDVYSEEEE